MKIIDKLVYDGVIEVEDKKVIIFSCCPSEYGFKDITERGKLCTDNCKECWNRELKR